MVDRRLKAVVFGAAGHIGSAVVRALIGANYVVTACSRRPQPPANLSGLPVLYSAGDFDNPGQLEKWVAGHDLVVDAAAPYPLEVFSAAFADGSLPIFQAERRTRRVLDAVRRHGSLLVYVSSFITLAHPVNTIHRYRADIVRLVHPYFEVKRLIESWVLDSRRDGIRAIIVNPTYCVGPWDLHDRRICTIPMLLCGEIPGSISPQKIDVIDVRDVALGLIAAIDGKRYHSPLLLKGHSMALQELYSLICEIGGVPAPTFSAAAAPTLIGAYWLELVLGFLGRQARLPSAGMMMATAFDHVPRDGFLKEVGIQPRPLRETLGDAINWYRELGYC